MCRGRALRLSRTSIKCWRLGSVCPLIPGRASTSPRGCLLGPATRLRGGHFGGAIETVGDGVAIQRVSLRQQRATDFRVVQGALNADGMGNLLSGHPRNTAQHDILLQRVTRGDHGHRGAKRRRGDRCALLRAGLLPQGHRHTHRHPRSRGWGLHNSSSWSAVRAGHEDRDTGWRRPP